MWARSALLCDIGGMKLGAITCNMPNFVVYYWGWGLFLFEFFYFFFILLFYHLVLLCSQLWQTSWRFCQGNGCRFPWKRDLSRVLKRLLITAGGERPRGREKVRLGNTELNINSIKFAYETRNYWTFSLISTASCLVKKSQAFHQMDEFHPRN